MKLDTSQLGNFIRRIRLHRDGIGKYRSQIENLRDQLTDKIKYDTSMSRFPIAGSWNKSTISLLALGKQETYSTSENPTPCFL